ncbi:hypothetical protein [Pseudosulfitobacter pseudonitzschiae]|uniref:hypothetical protein n=1 Tax=Pseudosulfitobacter pseudonitzschiae TaxID=1402135 RepID=UPI001AF6CD96|nr:hypothetical protein [Pseudosulfitobacter pseudonitzschiae]MBM1816181.1 hypothetical protein [Pseudosulfitobacter pseudonitzschiae]MBM1833672.1 hypothetical protein [Pseudosulfitobacter pseudonitzschiae]MBM1838538.1 hypothetical protein [Pseudosulfitobacter pseudonitzschiae]MBM1842886.1 hypothetical protein [Pseudosulfitobacter pseudonitzschiae]MBM1847752.1 hypothetical protein [Pseudosulfitobacter pseudonitzschiae]
MPDHIDKYGPHGQAYFGSEDQRKWVREASRAALRSLPIIATETDESSIDMLMLRAMRFAVTAMAIVEARLENSQALKSAISIAGDRALRSNSSGASDKAYYAFREVHSIAVTPWASKSDVQKVVSLCDLAFFFFQKEQNLSALKAVNLSQQREWIQQDVFGSWGPLWGQLGTPDLPQAAIDRLEGFFARDPEIWRFWQDWYTYVLDGTPIDVDQLVAVSLIPDDVWEEGPEAVADAIREIEAHLVIEKFPQIEEIFESNDGLYDVRGVALNPGQLIDSILERVNFAFDTAIQSNVCDLSEMNLASKALRQAIRVADSDANSFEFYLRTASAKIKSDVASGRLADDDETAFLILAIDEAALQLRADHPDVAEAANTRTTQRLREIDDSKRLAVATSIDGLREGTTGRLNQEFGLAAEVTRDGESANAVAEAIKQSGYRAGKISLAERAKRAEGSGFMSATKIGMRAHNLIEYVIELMSGSGPLG